MLKFLMTGLLAALFANSAEAASFDCSKAMAPNEKLICSDPKLSAADETLNATFNADLVPLSESGKKAMRQSQLGWLKYTKTLCSDSHVYKPDPSFGFSINEPLECLKREYEERRIRLAKAVIKADKFTILRVDLYETPQSEDKETMHPGLFDIRHGYPQIDEPQNENESVWNEYIKKRVLDLDSPGEGPVDVSVDYDVSIPGPNAISTTIGWSYYAHGAAHGYNTVITSTWLLDKQRTLKPEDLFVADRDWQKKIAEICYDELMRRNAGQQGAFNVKDAATLVGIVEDPNRWTLNQQGLSVQFNQYEVGPYVAGAPKIEVSWQQLKPYLVDAPPINVLGNQ